MTPAHLVGAVTTLAFVTVVATVEVVALGYNHPDSFAQVAMVHVFRDHGLASFATGTTNYLFKMPVYYLVSLLGLSPHRELMVDASLGNCLGLALVFTAIYLVANRLVGVTRRRAWLIAWLACLILATNLPHVLLANYPNSRNVELGLGLVGAYLIVKHCAPVAPGRPGRRWWGLPAVCLLLVFVAFSDPLMLYSLLGPVYLTSVALALLAARRHQRRGPAEGPRPEGPQAEGPRPMAVALIGAALALGFVSQDLLTWLAAHAIVFARPESRPLTGPGREVGELNRSLRYGLNVDFGLLDVRYGFRTNGFETDYVNAATLALAAVSALWVAVRAGWGRWRYLAFVAAPALANGAELALVDPDQANLSRYLVVSTVLIWTTAVFVIVLARRPGSRLVALVFGATLLVALTTGVMNLRRLTTSPWYRADDDVTQTIAILQADGIPGVWTTWDRSLRLTYLSQDRLLTAVPDCSGGTVAPARSWVNLQVSSQQRAAVDSHLPYVLVGPVDAVGAPDPCGFVRADDRYAFVTTTPLGDVYRTG